MRKKSEKNIYLLGSSSFLNDIGSEMITPILPFYIAAFGGTGLAIGLISGLREGLSSLVKLFGGWLSDKTGKRRNFVLLGYIMSALFKLLLGFADTASKAISFVSLERFGKLRDAPRDAIIAETEIKKNRGHGFGIQQFMDASGAIVGSLLVILLLWKFGVEFRTIIFIAAIFSSFAILPLFFIKNSDVKPKNINFFYGVSHIDKKLKYLIFVLSVFTFANFGLYLFILLIVKNITGSFLIALIFYLVFHLFSASFTLAFGNLSDKVGRKKILLSGFILFFVVSFGFLLNSTNLLVVGVLFSTYGLVHAITIADQRAFVSDLAGKNKGTAIGVYYFVVGTVNILAGIIAGLLWNISPSMLFLYTSVVGFISIILLTFVEER